MNIIKYDKHDKKCRIHLNKIQNIFQELYIFIKVRCITEINRKDRKISNKNKMNI